jgi:hypothetical protein
VVGRNIGAFVSFSYSPWYLFDAICLSFTNIFLRAVRYLLSSYKTPYSISAFCLRAISLVGFGHIITSRSQLI